MTTRTMRFLIGLLFVALLNTHSQAAILTTAFFDGTIEKFDEEAGTQSTFASFDPGAGLSGIAYSSFNNQVYVSALNFGGVYRLDSTTGATLGFAPMGIGPGGLAVAGNGNVYVTNFGANDFRIYDSTLTSLIDTISIPAATVTSGIGIASNGNAIVSTPGGGVFQYDGTSVTSFSTNDLASAQVAIDGNGDVYIGHGLGLSDNAFKFASDGTPIGNPFLTVTEAMVDGVGGSSPGTSPAGMAIDGDGNLIVSVLGRSNPGDAGGQRGGLFKYDTNGTLIETIASGTSAFGNVTIVPSAVPEPSSFALLLTAAGVTSVFRRRRR